MRYTRFFSMILFAMVLQLTTTHAQGFMAGTGQLNLGLGFGTYVNYDYTGSDFSTSPNACISFDEGIVDSIGGTLGIGVFAAYGAANYSDVKNTFLITGSWKNVEAGLRVTYHFQLKTDKFDPYIGVGGGLIFQSFAYTTDDKSDSTDHDYSIKIPLVTGLVGAKYMFTNRLGIFVEAGYNMAMSTDTTESASGVGVKAGLTFHL